MTARACTGCGTPEQRGFDAKGRPTVNLDPSTKDLPFDGRAAAARSDE